MGEIEGKSSGSMAYPRKGTLNRLLFKTPLFLWRAGLGPLLSHPRMGGSRMLALTSIGRATGKPRHTILSCASTGGKDYVCSGWAKRSDWAKNLLRNPLVTIQTYRKTYAARAYRVTKLEEFSRVAEEMFLTSGDSHFKPWLESYGINYDREDMIAKRSRLYIFGFEPVDDVGPEPLPADLRWIWLLIIAYVSLIWGALIVFNTP